ncbi:hypothetical protein B0H13DRAFT_1904926 [Mycena leptocephala]|nr:hypothetical protein B0H13DRAFT_1904926 [Mycena leptocephala]
MPLEIALRKDKAALDCPALSLIPQEHGIYSVLFFQSVQVLCSRRKAHYKFHLGCMILLFLLSTIHIALAYTWAFITDRAQTGIYELFSLDNPLPVLYGPDDAAIVYSRKIYRCYVIWGCNWRPVAFPAFSYTCTLIGGILGIIPLSGTSERAATAVCMATIFCTNVLAASLAAGRIWYISRRIARLLGKNSRKKYMDLTAIMLESGLIYPAGLVISVGIFLSPVTPTASVLICIAACYHIVGIAPTLIIVRVGLGVSTEDVDGSTLGGPQTREELSRQWNFDFGRREKNSKRV